MRRLTRFIGRVLPPLLKDGAGIAGAGLLAYGAWLIYEPAGFIVGGLQLLAVAVLLNVKSAKPDKADK